MSRSDAPWWMLEDPCDAFVATADDLMTRDEARRVTLRVLDDLFEGRALSSAIASAGVVAALGAVGLAPGMLNFARNAVESVHSKVAASIPTVRAAGHGADSSQRRRARLLTKFIAGASHELGLDDVVRTGAMGMLRTGTACTIVREADGRVSLEDASPRDLVVDPDDGRQGRPRVLYHVPLVDRRALAHRFPDSHDTIMSVAGASPDDGEVSQWRDDIGASEAVRLYEAWVLPLGDEPGRHVAAVQGRLLMDEEWCDPRHPIAVTRMLDPVRGNWGLGLLERLDAIQYEIDELVAHIGQSIRHNNLKIIVDDPQAELESISDPAVGAIIRCRAGSSPKWVTPQAVAQQDIQWLKELIGWLYQMAGMDEGAASSQRPAGLNSGRAIQFYHDFQSLRHAAVTMRIGQHVRAVVDRIIDAAKRLHCDGSDGPLDDEGSTDRAGSWSVRYSRGSEVRDINWSEVDMDRDSFVIELEEASAFPDSLAGRMQQIEQDAAEGRVPPEQLAQLRLDPDLEARWTQQATDQDYVEWVIERLLDPEKPMPAHLDEAPREALAAAVRSEVLRAVMSDEDVEVVQRLQGFLAEEVAAMAPEPAMPGAMPGGPLVPQLPTSDAAGQATGPGQMLS